MKNLFLFSSFLAIAVQISHAQTKPVTTEVLPSITVPNTVVFVNGASYTAPNPTPNTNNNPVGRFSLSNNMNSSTLYSVTISFTGLGNNIIGVKLWKSSDDTFNSGTDVQIGSTVGFDTSVTFSGLATEIPYPSSIYFL